MSKESDSAIASPATFKDLQRHLIDFLGRQRTCLCTRAALESWRTEIPRPLVDLGESDQIEADYNHARQMTLSPVRASVRTKSCRRSVPAVWDRSIGPETQGWVVTSR